MHFDICCDFGIWHPTVGVNAGIWFDLAMWQIEACTNGNFRQLAMKS